jgi:hypothetical protein
MNDEQKKFVEENYLKMSKNKMAQILNVRFSLVLSYCNSKKLKAPPELIQKFRKQAHQERIQKEKSGIYQKLNHPFYQYGWNPITGFTNAAY